MYFIFADIEMTFIGIEKALGVEECARSQSSKTVQNTLVMEFSEQTPTAMQIVTWHKNSKRKVVCAGEKDQNDQRHQKRRSSVYVKKSCIAQINRKEEKSGIPALTNSLAHPEETLDNNNSTSYDSFRP